MAGGRQPAGAPRGLPASSTQVSARGLLRGADCIIKSLQFNMQMMLCVTLDSMDRTVLTVWLLSPSDLGRAARPPSQARPAASDPPWVCGTRCPGLDAGGDAGPGQPHSDTWPVPTCEALSQQSRRCLETQQSSFQNSPGLSRPAMLLLNPSISATDTTKAQMPSHEVLGARPLLIPRLPKCLLLMRCWVSTPTPSAQGSSPARPGQAGLGFCRNGARYTPGPRGPGGPGAEAALPEAHSSRCLFPPLDRAEGRCARGRDVQEPRRRQCP